MAETFDHIVHVYGRPSEGSATRLDHELQVGEVIDLRGQQVRVVSARTENREDGRVRIVTVEAITPAEPER